MLYIDMYCLGDRFINNNLFLVMNCNISRKVCFNDDHLEILDRVSFNVAFDFEKTKYNKYKVNLIFYCEKEENKFKSYLKDIKENEDNIKESIALGVKDRMKKGSTRDSFIGNLKFIISDKDNIDASELKRINHYLNIIYSLTEQ